MLKIVVFPAPRWPINPTFMTVYFPPLVLIQRKESSRIIQLRERMPGKPTLAVAKVHQPQVFGGKSTKRDRSAGFLARRSSGPATGLVRAKRTGKTPRDALARKGPEASLEV